MRSLDNFNGVVYFAAAAGLLFVIILMVVSSRAKRLREQLELMVRELGWYDTKWSNFFGSSLRGRWNGYSVRIRQVPRQKSIPERIVSDIKVQAPARVIVTRRQRGFFSGRPFTLFGPPLVDLPLYQQFWIRADEITIVERLMHSSAAAVLDRMLLARYDVLRMGVDNLLVQRVSTNEPEQVARLAREELQLLRTIVDALALRP